MVDGPHATRTPNSYQEFVGGSRGEVSTAKHVYVALRSGWFSCRSACYLAAGRPAVLQDTGFSRLIPCGEGLLAFSSVEEAARMIEAVENDYDRHSAAAVDVCRKHFDACHVLEDLIAQAWEP